MIIMVQNVTFLVRLTANLVMKEVFTDVTRKLENVAIVKMVDLDQCVNFCVTLTVPRMMMEQFDVISRGYCQDGCQPGWFNETCLSQCSGTCVNRLCQRQTGDILADW
ncbi:hypothetical protein CHS0354_022150 [Potamilus streckersoni]|uniref:Uncharacterized protein n=1 Tax=Potamilus streckersoni TaxID=2493646 RepID=A0AAE0RTN1_9BIVA|nr:hypothetical protein CHS0354_022150 [Potamilus streckersoni]